MSALPTPSRANKRPLGLRADMRGPDMRGAERSPSLTPRRASQPRYDVADAGVGERRFTRLWKAALLASVAGCSAFGVVKVASVVEHTDALPLRSIVVSGVAPAANSADGSVSPRIAEIKAWSELAEGAPFFGIDADAVEARVEGHPFVRSASVRRLGPDTLEIAVEERTPRAAVRTPAGLYLLDDDGEVMKRARPGDALDVPVLSLREPTKNAAALSLLRATDKVLPAGRLSEIVELEATGFELVLDDGARVRVGDNDFDRKLARLAQTEQRLTAHGRGFSFMWLDDARHPERVAVRLRSTTETSSNGG